MRKNLSFAVLTVIILISSGCAVTLPTNSYTPQNFARVSGKTTIGQFEYLPYFYGIVKTPNQIQNTTPGSILISTDVANFIQRGTALELEKSGIILTSSAPYILSAKIVKLVRDDLGYSVSWQYSIQYQFTRKSDNQIVYDRTFTPEETKTSQLALTADQSNTLNEVILSAYDIFIRDPNIIQYLQPSVILAQ